jgi:glycerol-3-phosphate acyltransferase PlsY
VNTAVAARNNQASGPVADELPYLVLQVSDVSAEVYLDRESRLAQQLANPGFASAGAPPPGSRIQKKVNGLGSHYPMLQCAGLFSQNGRRMLELGVKFLISYFIGSLMGAMIVGKLRGGVDIRTMGSGNAGGTNALRTQGVMFALGVVIVRTWLRLVCSAAAVFGHVWPIYHGFKGGKGGATLVGTLVILSPKLIIGVLLVWGWVVAMTGYVGLATMTAASALPIWLGFKHLPDNQPLFIYLTVMALFVIYWHRSNIQRMRDGVEHRNVKIMLFKPRESTGGNDQS